MKNELVLYSKEELEQYLVNVWEVMCGGIECGIFIEGVLFGKLCVLCCVVVLCWMLVSQDKIIIDLMVVVDWINMFVLVVNEENVVGGCVVIVLINGVCGIILVVLVYYDKFICEVNVNLLVCYLLVVSVIGFFYKMNVLIFGVEVGCQGEVGVVCLMVVVGLVELLGVSLVQVCIVVEIVMEYNFGLMCDLVVGQVQVLCIECNVIVVVKVVNVVCMVLCCISELCVCFDKVIEIMYEIGKDMNVKYCEIFCGGLVMKIVVCD